MAVGYNSQIIMVLPRQDIVVVVTGRGPPRFQKIIDYVRNAAVSTGPLPDNSAGQAQLNALGRCCRQGNSSGVDGGRRSWRRRFRAGGITSKSTPLNCDPFKVLTVSGDHPSFDAVERARNFRNPLIHRRPSDRPQRAGSESKMVHGAISLASWTGENRFVANRRQSGKRRSLGISLDF